MASVKNGHGIKSSTGLNNETGPMTSQTETEGRIYYTESDRIIWEEELDSFVPARFFDAHSHLWSDDCLPADHPGRGPTRSRICGP